MIRLVEKYEITEEQYIDVLVRFSKSLNLEFMVVSESVILYNYMLRNPELLDDKCFAYKIGKFVESIVSKLYKLRGNAKEINYNGK